MQVGACDVDIKRDGVLESAGPGSSTDAPEDAKRADGFQLRQRMFIDSHKGATLFFVLGCIAYFDAWQNTTAWVYLGLHGTYGVMWVLKSMTFGDKQWEKVCPLWYGGVIWGGLSLYWIAPVLICWRNINAPPWLIGTAVAVYSLGVFFHFASDMQKHISLQLNPGHLFEGGLWARSRNPNYFGELLIYFGFSVLALHWAPLASLALFFVAVWVPNMIRKDRSLSRHPGFAAWKKKSGILFPQVF